MTASSLALSPEKAEDWGWVLTSRIIRDLGDIGLSPTQFAVLVVVSDSVTRDALCATIAASTIAKRACLCRTAALRAISDLEKLGFLSVDRNDGRVSRYRVVIPTSTQDAPVPEEDRFTRRTRVVHEKDQGGSREGLDQSTTCTLNKKPKGKQDLKQKEQVRDADSEFDLFWSAYPRKVAKTQARKAWKNLGKKRAPVADIVAAVERHKLSKQWQKDGGQFIPHPATWLRGRRWNDELETVQSTGVDEFGWPISNQLGETQ